MLGLFFGVKRRREVITEYSLCKSCMCNNGTQFCDAGRIADLPKYKNKKCDCYIRDLFFNENFE